jgi:hypothetical protein
MTPIRLMVTVSCCLLLAAGCAGTDPDADGGLPTIDPMVQSDDDEDFDEALLAPEGQCPDEDGTDPGDEATAAARCLVDHARAEHGVGALEVVDELAESARRKAQDMRSCEEFEHRACGRDAEHFQQEVGYGDGCLSFVVGENLGLGTGPIASPREIVEGWLRSPGHRENMLREDFEEHGIAAIELGDWRPEEFDLPDEADPDGLVWVHHLGTRSGCP